MSDKKTILLVEDEPVTSLAEKRILERNGFSVITADTGKKAVAVACKTKGIDLILMDIDLGEGIDGTEAAQQILAVSPIPLIFLSSHTEPEIVAKTEGITSYGYVVKNTGETVLLASIKMAFRLFEARILLQHQSDETASAHEELQAAFEELEAANEELVISQEEILEREKQLHESEERFRTIVESAPDPIFIQTDKKFAYLNPAALKLFGAREATDLLGTPVFDRFHPDCHEAVRERIRMLNEENKPVTPNFEQKYLRMDNSQVWVETAAVPFLHQGKNGALVFVRDTTERREALESLRRSEENFRKLFEEHTAVKLLIDPATGEIVDANLAAGSFYGWSREKLKTMSIYYINTMTQNEIREEMKAAEDPSKNFFEFSHRLADGSVRDVDVFSSGITLSGRDLLYSIVFDSTGRKAAERALVESERKVREKLDTLLSPEGDLSALELSDIIDTDKLQQIMDDIHKLTGITSAIIDIRGKVMVAAGWQDICTKFHRANPESAANCLESDTCLSSGIPAGEYRLYKCRNNLWDVATPIIVGGNHVGNLFIGQFLFEDEVPDYSIFREQARRFGFDEDEYIAALYRAPRRSREDIYSIILFYSRFAGLIADLSFSNLKLAGMIGRQSQTEAELESKTRLLKYITDNMSDLVSLTDLQGIYEFVGRSHSVLGYDPDFLIGRNIMQFVHPDDIATVMKEYADGMQRNEERKTEYRYRHSDGSYIWFETIGKILHNSSGAPAKLIFSTRDITERREIEKELRDSQEQIKNQLSEKEALLREVHHRIKNNFASVESILYLQSQSVDNSEALSIIQNAIGRIRSIRLIYDKLLFTEHQQTISIKDYISELTDTIIGIYPDIENITIEKDIEDFSINEKKLFPVGLIINELLTNTMKYAFKGRGSGLIRISVRKKDSVIVLILEDNGLGMPPDFDIENSRGLGLMLVKMFSEQSGGGFTIENNQGTKNTVHFKI